MQQATCLESSAPETGSGARPPPSAPIRLSLNGAPEHARAGLYREFVSRSVVHFDVEPLRNVPLQVDITLQGLPGLQLFSGRLHGSHNRRTRPMLADGKDDFSLIVNLGGPYRVTQGQRELVLGDGEATLVTSAEPCSFAHQPPGGVLALLFPRTQFAPLVAGVEDVLACIPRHNPALGLLTDYVRIAGAGNGWPAASCGRSWSLTCTTWIAVAVGATPDAAELARGRGIRARGCMPSSRTLPATSSGTICRWRRSPPPPLHAALRPAAVRAEGTTFTGVLAQRLARAHRMLADPAPRGEDQRRLRCLRRRVLFQSRVPPALRRGAVRQAQCARRA